MTIEDQVIAIISKVSYHEAGRIKPNHTIMYDLGVFLEAADDLFYELAILNPSLPSDLDLTKYFVHTSPTPRRLVNTIHKFMNRVIGTKFTPIEQLSNHDITVSDLVDSVKSGYWTFDK